MISASRGAGDKKKVVNKFLVKFFSSMNLVSTKISVNAQLGIFFRWQCIGPHRFLSFETALSVSPQLDTKQPQCVRSLRIHWGFYLVKDQQSGNSVGPNDWRKCTSSTSQASTMPTGYMDVGVCRRREWPLFQGGTSQWGTAERRRAEKFRRAQAQDTS